MLGKGKCHEEKWNTVILTSILFSSLFFLHLQADSLSSLKWRISHNCKPLQMLWPLPRRLSPPFRLHPHLLLGLDDSQPNDSAQASQPPGKLFLHQVWVKCKFPVLLHSPPRGSMGQPLGPHACWHANSLKADALVWSSENFPLAGSTLYPAFILPIFLAVIQVSPEQGSCLRCSLHYTQ